MHHGHAAISRALSSPEILLNVYLGVVCNQTNYAYVQEDQENGTLRNYLTFGTRRSSSVSQYGNTPIVIRRSRSSNGELATVVEQVGTLQGRSTRSNYTLLEAAEKERDTDSDDENYFQGSRYNSDESFAVRGNHEEDSKLTANSHDSVLTEQETPPTSKSDVQSPTCPQEGDSTITEQQIQDHDAENNSTHHDLPVQQYRETVEKEIINTHNEELTKQDNKRLSERCKEAPNELLETPLHDRSQQTGAEPERGSIPSQGSEIKLSPQVPKNNNPPQSSEGKKICQTFLPNTPEPILAFSTNLVEDKGSSPEIDHAAILREFVQQPSPRSRSLLQGEEETCLSTLETKQPKEEPDKNLNIVELKIVESTDSLFEEAYPVISGLDSQKSLTTSDIPHLSDDSDVVFIDAGSPSLSRTKLSCTVESLSASNEVIQDRKERANALTSAQDTPAKPPPIPQTPEPGTECKKSETSKDNVVIRRRHNSTNSFRDLPIRSPTPPRRRPQKSPRTPKLREKTRQRHSSLALTSDEETQELLSNGTRSASPTSKTGDFRFFSFSLKKEKSKSATSLGSKRNKEKVRLTSMKLSLENHEAVNPKFVPSQTEEGHIVNPGKRVGVRSMMIDGTIKRNFIVIHPSDDSDTIGLAPKSPQTTQKELSVSTPEALASVKTHITAPSKEKFEMTKQLSMQGGLKEELLSDIPENIRTESRSSFRGSLNFSQISKSLRIKQSKKNWEHVSLRSSHSLSSEPVCPSPSSSQILYKSPSSMSRVDCDSPNTMAEKPDLTGDSRTVSKFCVVM